MSHGCSVEEIDKMILGRLKGGPATNGQIQASLIPTVDLGWIVRRMAQLKAEKKVSQTGSAGMWCLSEVEPASQPSEGPIESTAPAQPAEEPEEEESQETAEESQLGLKDVIMLEIKKAGKLTVKDLYGQLKGKASSNKLYNALYDLEMNHSLVREKIGRPFHWRIPTETEKEALSLLTKKHDQEVETQPPTQEVETPPAPQIAETPQIKATVPNGREEETQPAPRTAGIPGRLEITRKYYIPMGEVKKRFPELVGDIRFISVVEVADSSESELIVETGESISTGKRFKNG